MNQKTAATGHRQSRSSSPRLLFLMFLISGFCGLLDQVVWLRLAFAKFGVITPVISVVLSVFMFGLSLGSWAAGKWVRPLSVKLCISPILIYGAVEALIGLSAWAVPLSFDIFSQSLLSSGDMSSTRYLMTSAFLMMISILPWCFLMGMTFPLGVAFLETIQSKKENTKGAEKEGDFSFLYLGNVIGAMLGTALTAMVFVELLGFRKTLILAALLNFLIGAMSVILAMLHKNVPLKKSVQKSVPSDLALASASSSRSPVMSQGLAYGLLFSTGFCSMAMEVVWTRAFTPITKTTIYAFAFLLTTYLLATWLGSLFYRIHLSKQKTVELGKILYYLAIASLLPLILNDPRLHPKVFHIFISLFPICALLGYLTPQLIERYSRGSVEKAGNAYAVNVLGCILGPLIAGYVLLPFLGVKGALLILAIPLFGFMIWVSGRQSVPRWVGVAVLLLGVLASHSYEYRRTHSNDQLKRDHTATVIATGEGMGKQLLVNGIGITVLTPITKLMAHFPLSHLKEKPESALVICFGMGTTFRSLLSWGIHVTAVELVPSVKEVFGYFHQDAHEVLNNPNGKVQIDDGRRFLSRSTDQYDLITLDPPPPVEAAGSSLLYSREFYDVVKNRLKPGGILQQWYPGGEEKILHSIARSIGDAFPHVRVYQSYDLGGYHFLASQEPIVDIPLEDQVNRMPKEAQADLVEWFPGQNVHAIYTQMLKHEIPLASVMGSAEVPLLSDDRPYNEYYLLRRAFGKKVQN